MRSEAPDGYHGTQGYKSAWHGCGGQGRTGIINTDTYHIYYIKYWFYPPSRKLNDRLPIPTPQTIFNSRRRALPDQWQTWARGLYHCKIKCIWTWYHLINDVNLCLDWFARLVTRSHEIWKCDQIKIRNAKGWQVRVIEILQLMAWIHPDREQHRAWHRVQCHAR